MPATELTGVANVLALLRLGRRDPTRSILPFLPRSLRFLLLLVLLLNYRALPFVWHLRTFSSVIQVRLQGIFKWFNHDKRRRFVEHLSPIGENPFELTVTYSTTVGLSDCDYNGHLSNSAYAKNLDYARMRAAVICFPSILEAKGWLGLGTSHFHFIREIPLWAEYEIRINIASWEDKWLNLVVQFVTYPNGKGYVQGTRIGPFTVERVKHVVKDVPIPPDDENPVVSTPEQFLSSSPLTAINANSNGFTPEGEMMWESDHHRGRSRSPRPCYRTSSTTSSSSFSSSTSSTSTASSSSSSSSKFIHSISVTSDDAENGSSETSSPITSPSPSLPSDSPPNSSPSKVFTSLPSLSSSTPPNTTATTAPATATTSTTQKITTAMPALPEGAVLHCVHVSSYCFKQGRMTIPPRVALVVSGFGDRTQGRWERVQEIRHSRGTGTGTVAAGGDMNGESTVDGGERGTKGGVGVGGLRGILRGGWRKYEQEGLWNLDEYEEQRRRGVEMFGSLRTRMNDFGV